MGWHWVLSTVVPRDSSLGSVLDHQLDAASAS
jgi:hypothetical protein